MAVLAAVASLAAGVPASGGAQSGTPFGTVDRAAGIEAEATHLAAASADSPVADAAQRGDLDEVRRLLRRGADVNAPQGDGMTALHWAAELGHAELCDVLLFAGARVDAGTRIGHYTPLHLAARAARETVARTLLSAGADPNAATTNSGVQPLHLAAQAGDPAVVRALVEGGAEVDGRESAWGQTPLVFAASAGRAAVIEALVEAGADPGVVTHTVDVAEQERADRAAERRIAQFIADFKEKEGGGPEWQPTPSQVQAAIEASREIQRRWPDVPDPADDGREEAEGEEGEGGEPAPGQEPAPPEDPEAADTPPESPGQGEPAVAARPAGATAAPDSARPGTPAASAQANPATIPPSSPDAESDSGAESDSMSEDGSDHADDEAPRPLSYAEQVGSWGGLTPLLHAVRQGHAGAVAALLDAGAEINQVSAGDSTSPLLMAAVNGQFDLLAVLLDHGADPNLASQAGATPLFAVIERQWAPRASYAHPTEHLRQDASYLDAMGALLAAGADPNARLETHLWYMEYTFGVLRGSGINLQGATPFWRAAYALDVQAMRLLKERGADPDVPTTKPPQRRRPAPEADGAAEELDPSGLPPVPVGGPAIHPVHAASGVGYGQSFAGNAHRHVPDGWMPALRFLVEECGADVNARDANGYTPLHHAASRGDMEMLLYLVDHGADVKVVSRKGETTADMANGPVQRVRPFPATVALLEELGSGNNHRCLSC